MSPDDKTYIKILLDEALEELSEDKKAAIRAEGESLSLPAIADIVLEAT